MTRNFKVLGLAVMAVLAVSAVAASAASAQNGRITSTGNFTLTGTEIAGEKNGLSFNGLETTCPGSTYDAHKYNVTPHVAIPSGAETATITPTYKQVNGSGDANCRSNPGNLPTTIDMNGCDYVAHLGVTTGVANQYFVTYDLVCPEGKNVTVTIWFSEAEHTEKKESCTLHIAPKAGLGGGTVKDTGLGDLTLNGTVGGFNVVETKDGLHPLLCPAKEGEGKFNIGLTVKADAEVGGGNTSISLSHL
jgi:hypothetical protein